MKKIYLNGPKIFNIYILIIYKLLLFKFINYPFLNAQQLLRLNQLTGHFGFQTESVKELL